MVDLTNMVESNAVAPTPLKDGLKGSSAALKRTAAHE